MKSGLGSSTVHTQSARAVMKMPLAKPKNPPKNLLAQSMRVSFISAVSPDTMSEQAIITATKIRMKAAGAAKAGLETREVRCGDTWGE